MKPVRINASETAVNHHQNLLAVSLAALILFFGVATADAQSTTQDLPTPVVSNEISGTIKARDLGDSRITTYYYAINGEQGDLFINLVTHNFTGDIDVFTINGLKPVTKIVVYADYGDVETGRAIYLRKAERLLLRVQGKTPNDDPATFRLKFAGSFVAGKADDATQTELPKVSGESRGNVRVNSVGTIIPSPPRATEARAEKDDEKEPEAARKAETKTDEDTASKSDVRAETKSAPEVVVTDPVEPKPKAVKPPVRRNTAAQRRAAVKAQTETAKVEEKKDPSSETASNTSPEPVAATKQPPSRSRPARNAKKPPAEPKVDPLASVNLVIQFKNGDLLEKKMNEVFRFSVDKGVLTVILKDGAITKYPVTDIAKLTIE